MTYQTIAIIVAAIYIGIGTVFLVIVGRYTLWQIMTSGGRYILLVPLCITLWPFFWRDIREIVWKKR